MIPFDEIDNPVELFVIAAVFLFPLHILRGVEIRWFKGKYDDPLPLIITEMPIHAIGPGTGRKIDD